VVVRELGTSEYRAGLLPEAKFREFAEWKAQSFRTAMAADRINESPSLTLAFAYNILGIPIAAGILYPFFGILINPMISAASTSLSSVSVIANSLKLRCLKLKR
jgi:cation transport ATPase